MDQSGRRRFLWDDEIIPLERAAEVVSTSLELFEQHRFGLWAVRLKGSTEICGFTGMWPFRDPPEFELLYGMAEPLWGKGYAVEMAQAVLTYCYDTLDMSVVRASINAPHVASARVLEKLGFTCVRQVTVGGVEHVFFERVRLRGAASASAKASADKSAGQGSTLIMPFKSKAQRRKFAELLVTGKITPETYEEWNRETGGKILPERVTKKKTAKKRKTAKRKISEGEDRRVDGRRR